ncbi:hypothetical protein CPAV1605_1495 [seawater metagenome]|uniref:Uncharacterized protein n=1 Tax=seawater metagenome TaxID=1561972 RepID=A0A5E8CLD9_9ZZZZ
MDNFVKELKLFSKITGKLNTFITFLLYNQSDEEINKFLDHKIKIINGMKDNYKKQRALDKIYQIKEDFNNYPDNNFKNKGILYLVNEEFNKFQLEKNVLKIVRQEFEDNIYFNSGDFFETDYIIDMLTNFEFNNLLLLDNKKAYLYHINTNKTRLIETISKLDESLIVSAINSKFKGQYILGGNGNFKNTFFKNNKGSIIEDLKIVSFKPDKIQNIKEQALDVYKEKEEADVIKKLNEYLGNLHQYEHLLLFNNQRIIKFLENYLLKTIIIHVNSPIYETIKSMDTDSIEYHVLSSNNQECKNFINDYNGVIAEMRYEMPKESFDTL